MTETYSEHYCTFKTNSTLNRISVQISDTAVHYCRLNTTRPSGIYRVEVDTVMGKAVISR